MIAELAIPRPRTLADCGQEARPCPWVGCRHHLLLEVAQAMARKHCDRRPTSLRLNGPPRGGRKIGRRPGLASNAAANVVRGWIDDALEMLIGRLEYTCTFDFVSDFPDGAEAHVVARVLGVSDQLIDAETLELVSRPDVKAALAPYAGDAVEVGRAADA